MQPNKKLAAIFTKFAGREVDTDNMAADATLKELREELGQVGFRLRVWTPGSMGTMDHCMDRVNIHLQKGKCTIGKNFRIG